MTCRAFLRRALRFRRACDRGATLVEYALMLALVTVIVTTAVRGLGSKSSDSLETAHAGISTGAATTVSGGGSGGDGGNGGGGSGGNGGGGGGGGATTAPTTTVAPTTVAPTTVPATTIGLQQSSVSFGTVTTAKPGSSWTATATLTVKAGSQGVPGATVTLNVRSLRNGVWSEQTATVPTDGSGKASYTTPRYARTGPNQVTQVQLVVADVQVPAGYGFDGTKPFVTVDKPS